MNNVELIKKYRSYFKEKNITAAIEMISDDAVWNTDKAGGSWSGTHIGKQEIIQHFKSIPKEAQLISWETKSIFPYDDETVIEISYVMFKFIETQEIYESDAVCLYTISNEKITSYKIYENENKLIEMYRRVKLKQS